MTSRFLGVIIVVALWGIKDSSLLFLILQTLYLSPMYYWFTADLFTFS